MLMNENHRRHLATTLSHIDNLLAQAGRIAGGDNRPSPFLRFSPGTSEDQREVIGDHISRIRQLMTSIMEDLGLPRSEPTSSALWAIKGCITSALDAVAEIKPSIMSGYGELTASDIDAIQRVMSELGNALDQFKAELLQANSGEKDFEE